MKKRQKWTKEKIIEEIKKLGLDELSSKQIRMNNGALFCAACRHFGSWKNAIEFAGFDYNKIRGQQCWTKEKIIEEIKKLGLDELSSRGVQKNNSLLAYASVSHFGSWRKAVEVAGFDYNEIKKWQQRDKIKDLTGQIFGKLYVEGFSHISKHRSAYFLCKCRCGNEKTIAGYYLLDKRCPAKSCGSCYKISHIGERYGNLEVIEFSHSKNNKIYLMCVCDCGMKTVVSKNNLKSGNTSSCGCLKKVKQTQLAKILASILNEDPITIRPTWLKNPETNYPLEIDIYFPKSKIAVEYNGIQHYKPVNFSGKLTEEEVLEQLKSTRYRDRLKKRLIKHNPDKVKHFVIFSYRNRIEEENVKNILKKQGILGDKT